MPANLASATLSSATLIPLMPFRSQLDPFHFRVFLTFWASLGLFVGAWVKVLYE